MGGAAEPLFGPVRLGQRAAGVDGDGLALGVDLAGLLPVPADGGVVQPRIVGRHLTRRMIQEHPDHLLWDIAVDQPGAECVPPLMWREKRWAAVLVADVAAAQPVPQLAPVGVCAQGFAAVGVHLRGGE